MNIRARRPHNEARTHPIDFKILIPRHLMGFGNIFKIDENRFGELWEKSRSKSLHRFASTRWNFSRPTFHMPTRTHPIDFKSLIPRHLIGVENISKVYYERFGEFWEKLRSKSLHENDTFLLLFGRFAFENWSDWTTRPCLPFAKRRLEGNKADVSIIEIFRISDVIFTGRF